MIELIKYFRILFLSTKISRERLKLFTEDHIQRLNANNPAGIFTTILVNVTNAYNAYYGDMASESVNKAVQEGKTVAMKGSRALLEKQLGDNEKLVAYTYRNTPANYEEFYPLGMTEYYQADLPTFETIALRYKNVLTSHAADFPAIFQLDYDGLQATFVANRAAQLAAKGNVAAERSDIASTRPALALQLTTNLLTIALNFVGDESKADVYFDQSILNDAFREGERKVTSGIDPSATHNVFENITQADVRLVIENMGIAPDNGDLDFGFGPALNTPVTHTRLAIGSEISLTAGELGWTTENRFFNVTNPTGTTGSYKVEKI